MTDGEIFLRTFCFCWQPLAMGHWVLPVFVYLVAFRPLVMHALYSGNTSQGNCVLRSSPIGIVRGVLTGGASTFSKNGCLAVKFHTVPLPPKGRVLLQWLMLCQTEVKAMVVHLSFRRSREHLMVYGVMPCLKAHPGQLCVKTHLRMNGTKSAGWNF